MKFNGFKKASIYISSFILCFLFIVPLAEAEESNNDLSKKGYSVEGLKASEGFPQEQSGEYTEQAVTAVKQMVSSYDVKIPLNERFNAILCIEKPYITDFAGREIGINYNALIGFQIVLQ